MMSMRLLKLSFILDFIPKVTAAGASYQNIVTPSMQSVAWLFPQGEENA